MAKSFLSSVKPFTYRYYLLIGPLELILTLPYWFCCETWYFCLDSTVQNSRKVVHWGRNSFYWKQTFTILTHEFTRLELFAAPKKFPFYRAQYPLKVSELSSRPVPLTLIF